MTDARDNYLNPDSEGNNPRYRTGKLCVTEGCSQPAGTAWSENYCFNCNIKRMQRIDGLLDGVVARSHREDGDPGVWATCW